MNTRLSPWGPFLVFAAAALWATDAPFRIQLTDKFPSGFIVFAEHAIDILVALPILWYARRDLKRLSGREWLSVLGIAIGGSALASIAFTQAFHYVNPSVAILLQKVQPLIAITLASTFLHERTGRRFWPWAVLALAGAYLVSFPGIWPRLFEGEVWSPNLTGVSLALLAALLWGGSTVLGRYVLRTAAFTTLAALRFVIAFVFLGIINAVQGTFPPLDTVTSKDWLFISIIALTSGVFSLFLYYYGLRSTKASVATLAELGFPLAAVFVNAYFIEGLSRPGTFGGLYVGQWVGALLLLGALYMLTRTNREQSTEPA
jgi:drug/metabolite transporter (DMT)-like permease